MLLNLDKLTVNYWESLQLSVNCLLQDSPFIGRQFWAKINPNQGVASQREKKMKKHSYMYIKEDDGYSKGPFYPRLLWLLCWHQITFNIFLPWFIEFLIYKAVTLRKAFSRKGDISLFSTKAFCSERNTRNKSVSPSWACMKIFFFVNNWMRGQYMSRHFDQK